MIDNEKVGAVIVAAGSSTRMQGVDKTMALLGERPLLAHTLDVFQQSDYVDHIVLVLNNDAIEQGGSFTEEYGFSKVSDICAGGQLRADSVAEGLQRIGDCSWVIVHDGARPCLSEHLIEQGLKEASETGAAIAATPVKDTVKLVGPNSLISGTPSRGHLWMAQTPQVFLRDVIIKAYGNRNRSATDDAELVEALGYKVKVYEGSYDNIKVTTLVDLDIAESVLRRMGRVALRKKQRII
ncbi:MAG: 2-C-methyl-D-erythritol 4-phosphate cytidylyltransferase [Chloroflexota bacterium]|nr:2-C-methyl-D-erythritol 4-phosphate cytidylyltransferase [Chloroflexota bacterium]